MDEKVITIKFSQSQKDLLLNYEHDILDLDVAELFSNAVEKNGNYKLRITVEDLEFLRDDVCDIAEDEKNKDVQTKLDELAEYLDDCLSDLDQNWQEEGKDEEE